MITVLSSESTPARLAAAQAWEHKTNRTLLGAGCVSIWDMIVQTYVCVLYCSPCAPLMDPWLGELEGTSLAIS